MTDVRIAEMADLEEVRQLLRIGDDKHFPFNLNRSLPIIKSLLEFGNEDPRGPTFRGCFGVVGPVGGHLEALVMLFRGSVWYSDEVFLSQQVIIVHPDDRTKRHDETLRDWMTTLADKTGLKVSTGVFTTVKALEKVKLFSRTKGWRLMGAMYLYDPHNPVKEEPAPIPTEGDVL